MEWNYSTEDIPASNAVLYCCNTQLKSFHYKQLFCFFRALFGFLMVFKGLEAQLGEIKAASGHVTFQIAKSSLADRTVLASW